jgi:hypothetical protein
VLSELGGVQNPYFDKRQIVGFNRSYLTWRAVQSWRMARGIPYQIRGDADRGDAAPQITPGDTPNPIPPPAE